MVGLVKNHSNGCLSNHNFVSSFGFVVFSFLVCPSRSNTIGKSYQEAIDGAPDLTISKQGLQKAYKKHQKANATEAQPPTSAISWGQNLAHVSAVVDNERKTLPKPRSCAATIAAESAFPNLCSATVNTHMRKDLAGKPPRAFKRPTFISKEDHLRIWICAALARASGDLEPFSCVETQGILQEVVKGTDFADLFKGGAASRQFARAFRLRMSKKNGGAMQGCPAGKGAQKRSGGTVGSGAKPQRGLGRQPQDHHPAGRNFF